MFVKGANVSLSKQSTLIQFLSNMSRHEQAGPTKLAKASFKISLLHEVIPSSTLT